MNVQSLDVNKCIRHIFYAAFLQPEERHFEELGKCTVFIESQGYLIFY